MESFTPKYQPAWPYLVNVGSQYEPPAVMTWILYAILGTTVLSILLSTCHSMSDSIDYDRKRKLLGCGKIPNYPHRDPVFGLDLVLGMAKALRENRYLVWLNKVHENKPKTFLVNFARSRFIYTIEPENVKAMSAVVWKDFAVSPTRRNNKATFPFADKGVSTVDGKEWEHARFLIKGFFHRDVYTDTERLQGHTDIFMDLVPADGQTFDIQPLLQRWFLDVNSESLFGKSVDSLGHPERASIITAMRDVLRFLRLRLQWYKYLVLFRNQAWYDCVGKVHSYINKQIEHTYAEMEQFERLGKNPKDSARKDLICNIAQHVKNPDELRSHLSLMFVPNNDTTSIFIGHILWNLARRPDIWEELRQEVLAHGDEDLSFAVLRNMKWLNGVLNETHRLYPNGVTQVRMCVNDTTLPLGGGPDGLCGPDGTEPILVRKGDVVQANKNVMHRDPDKWGPDALEFKPERWDGMRPYWNFVPFGGGARRCPAQFLVTSEASYMLARLLRVYKRIEARDPAPYVGVMRVGPSNLTGVQVALYKS